MLDESVVSKRQRGFIVHSRRPGMDLTVTCKLHHTCLYLVSVHVSPDGAISDCGSGHLIVAYYSFMDPKRMKG